MTASVSESKAAKPAQRRRPLWGKILILCAASLFALLVAEIGLRVLKPGFPGLRMPQIAHRPAAGCGFEMVPSQRCFTFAEPVTINSAGFRGPELREGGSPDAIRVLCLGDSFTLGYGVGDDDAYPRQLERLLAELWPGQMPEVINAGVQGYATYHEIDFLKNRGLGLKPNIVVIAVYYNDLDPRPADDYTARYEQELREARRSLKHRAPWVYVALKNSAVATVAEGVMQAGHGGERAEEMMTYAASEPGSPVWKAMDKELAALARLAKEHGFFPLVVTLPARFQFSDRQPKSNYPGEVLAIAERHGLATLDVQPVLAQSLAGGVDVYLPWDNHFNAVGNRLVAAAVCDTLDELEKIKRLPGEPAADPVD